MFKSAAKRINGLEETSPPSQAQDNTHPGDTVEKFFPEIDDDEDFFTPVVVLRMMRTDPAGDKPD